MLKSLTLAKVSHNLLLAVSTRNVYSTRGKGRHRSKGVLTPKGEHLHFPQGNVLLTLPLECQLSRLLPNAAPGSSLQTGVCVRVCVPVALTAPPPTPESFQNPPAGGLGKQSRFQAPRPVVASRMPAHIWPSVLASPQVADFFVGEINSPSAPFAASCPSRYLSCPTRPAPPSHPPPRRGLCPGV